MIQTYFGIGKGKTTAAIGGLVRAIGSGKKALFAQFLKNDKTNECKTLKALGVECIHPNCEYEIFEKLTDKAIKNRTECCCKFFDELKAKITEYDFIVLDEVLDVVEFGYLPESRLVEIIKCAKEETEIVLTGHTVSEGIKEISDYLSFVDEIKHPYHKGAAPRKGIEY